MSDPVWIRGLLGIHIAAGATCFVLAPVALATAKGGKTHRRWGKVYFWAMAVVTSTALLLAIWRPILFLALVAIFSFYSAFRGYRVLGQKDRVRGGTVKALDWLAAGLTAAASLGLAVLGALRPAMVSHLGIPAMVFGCLGLWIVWGDVRSFQRPPREKMFWWYGHLQGMIGSYIAAWTAFSVVTIGPLLHGAWWIWVLPSAIGVPSIFATTAYYQRKFGPRAATPVSS
jgi:uncharacterized membrane protein